MAKRIALILLALILLLAVAAAVGLHFAAGTLRDKVREALGPESEVGEISLGLSAVEVRNVRVPGPKGWPTEDALRAERITVTPDLSALFSNRQVRINRISVEKAYLSVFRTRDGRLRLLPGMLEKKPETPAADAADSPALPVSIDSIQLSDSALELFDASVAQPAHRVRLEKLAARVDDLKLPELKSRTGISLEGVIKGVQQDGQLNVNGHIELASKDSEITTLLKGVDLVALQPYLIKAAETGVKRGSLDLDIKSTVKQNRLMAPGNLSINHLELAAAKTGTGTFMGMPRAAVVGMLKDRNDRITIKFILDGRLDDPRFSLNDTFMKRVGGSMAEGLGISFESVTKGVSGATQSIGSGLGKLFGK